MTPQSFAKHFSENLRLALPVTLGQVGIMVAQLADNIMVGQIGYKFLAASAFANAVQILFLFFGSGFAIAITAIVGHAFGARQEQNIKETFRDGFFLNFGLGILLFVLMWLTLYFSDVFGQEKEIVELAKPYGFYLALTLIPHMVFMHFKQFTEGLQKTVPAMVIGIIGNLLNILLNYLLIFGNFGFPEMGLNGAGLATLLFRVSIVFMFFGYFFFSEKYRSTLATLKQIKLNRSISLDIFKTGIPIGAQFCLEAGGFALAAIMVGWIGSTEQAAHQIAINLASSTFLAASGLASAATIRISRFLGEKRHEDLRRVGLVAFAQVVVFMLSMSALFVVFRYSFPSFFVKEDAVIQMAAQLLVVAAFFQLFDGVQVIGLGALRGLKDVQYSTLIAVIAYWCFGLPVSYVAGFVFNWGATGVWMGLAVGLGTASVTLFFRFMRKTKKLVADRSVV